MRQPEVTYIGSGFAVWVRAVVVFIAGGVLVLGITGCTSAGLRQTPLAGPRVVIAYTTMSGEIAIRHSPDAMVWTEPINLTDSGSTIYATGAPTIVYDEGFYHLYWVTPSGDLRYAASRGADAWRVQASALTSVSPSAEIAVSRGGGHHVALMRVRRAAGTSEITAIDLDAPTMHTTVVPASFSPPTIAFGRGRFIAAIIGSDRRVRIFSSPEGRQWGQLAQLPPMAMGASEAVVQFSDGAFQLATQELVSVGEFFSIRGCRRYSSVDGTAWSEVATPTCGNLPDSRVLAARLSGTDVYLVNDDNRSFRISRAGGVLERTAFSVIGRPSLAVGPGPRLAALRFDRVLIEGEGGQDVSVASLGFRVRIGLPDSARVTFSGALPQFATDLDTAQQAPIPARVSPSAWFIKPTPADQLTQPGAQMDLVGAIVVGVERGNCPVEPIVGKLQDARAAIQLALNRHVATADLIALQDVTQRVAILGRVQCEVEKSVAGQDPAQCVSAPPAPSIGVLEGLGWIVRSGAETTTGLLTSIACALNQDEPLVPVSVLGVGATLFPEEPPPRQAYALQQGSPERSLDSLRLRSANGAMVWRIDGRWLYVTE